jgi:predicted phage terminase large subunit-like protein
MNYVALSPSAQAEIELARRELARRSLLDFTTYTFPDYEVNWHHELLCQYLDRFIAGDIKRLLVSMPPRHGKSEQVSRRLPAYILGRNPDAEVMAASYSADLSRRFNRDVQRIIDSERYDKVFPETKIGGANIRTVAQGTWLRNADIFEIVNRRGVYKCAGVGGGLAGMGFNYGIIDDPVKDAKQANSETVRQSIWEWYSDVFWTRQAPDAGILLTMTRWNMDDLAGRIVETLSQDDSEEWVILTLPALLDNDTTKHPDDPREIGEPLWESRYPVEFLEKARAQNSYSFAALYQQNPIPHGENIFDTSQIEIIDHEPACTDIVRFYDLAVTAKKHSDYTAGVKLGITKREDIIILDVYRAQKKMPDIERDIAQNAAMDGKGVTIRLEAEKAGIVQLDYLLERPDMRGYTIDKKPPIGDKYTRAQPFASRVNAGKVKMIKAHWNKIYLDELAVFPLGANDDQVDASSGAYDMTINISHTEIIDVPNIFGR